MANTATVQPIKPNLQRGEAPVKQTNLPLYVRVGRRELASLCCVGIDPANRSVTLATDSRKVYERWSTLNEPRRLELARAAALHGGRSEQVPGIQQQVELHSAGDQAWTVELLGPDRMWAWLQRRYEDDFVTVI